MKKRLLDILKAYCKTERMKTMKIQKVLATEILDSRGTPTVGATVILSDGSVGTANAPFPTMEIFACVWAALPMDTADGMGRCRDC